MTKAEADFIASMNMCDEISNEAYKKIMCHIKEEQQWIPCSERLPEPDTFVLTYHRHLSFDYQYVSSIDETTGEWSGFCGNLSDEVLAWMPLPDAYEGETT